MAAEDEGHWKVKMQFFMNKLTAPATDVNLEAFNLYPTGVMLFWHQMRMSIYNFLLDRDKRMKNNSHYSQFYQILCWIDDISRWMSLT